MTKSPHRKITLAAGDALIVIDGQNGLVSTEGDPTAPSAELVEMLNRYLAEFTANQLPIYTTCNRNLAKHGRFQVQVDPWPLASVLRSNGVHAFSELIFPCWTVVLSQRAIANSAPDSMFNETRLEKRLRGHGTNRLFIGGLGTESSLLNTIQDALDRRFSIFLLSDAMQAVNGNALDDWKAQARMISAGAVPIQFENLARWKAAPLLARN